MQTLLNAVIAIDGKTLCHSVDEATGSSAIHMVSAFATEARLVLANEDNSRVRKDNAGENMALIRHITINMLNNAKKLFKNIGLKALRKKAGWDNETIRLIFGKNF